MKFDHPFCSRCGGLAAILCTNQATWQLTMHIPSKTFSVTSYNFMGGYDGNLLKCHLNHEWEVQILE